MNNNTLLLQSFPGKKKVALQFLIANWPPPPEAVKFSPYYIVHHRVPKDKSMTATFPAKVGKTDVFRSRSKYAGGGGTTQAARLALGCCCCCCCLSHRSDTSRAFTSRRGMAPPPLPATNTLSLLAFLCWFCAVAAAGERVTTPLS